MLLQPASIGILIALIPLCYVLVKGDHNKYRKLVWITAFLALDLIIFGSFTRPTDSDLGHPGWPGCYGISSPFHTREDTHAAQAAVPNGPVTWMKAWIEMTRRYFALASGVLIIMLVVLAWVKRKELQQSSWYVTAVLALVCVQGASGTWTVTLKLQSAIVVTHLLLGMSLLAALIWLGCKNDAPRAVDARGASLRMAVAIGLVLLVVQIALGGWVSTNYAMPACTDFPLCNGQQVPPVDFAHGLAFWCQLGKTAGGDFILHDALIAIHWAHRVFAVVVLSYLAWPGARAHRVGGLGRVATVLLVVSAVQLTAGLSNIVLGWPLLAAVVHNGGAAVLLLLMMRLHYLIGLAQARAPMPVAAAAV